jgi:chemotaxis protein histidine kinase CheA
MAPDPYQYFRIEANELVEQLDKGVLELDREPGPELVGRLLRVTHTLKGAARVVKVGAIADEAHAMEDALTPHRQAAGPVPPHLVRDLLSMVDRLRAHVAALPSEKRPSRRHPRRAGGPPGRDAVRAAVRATDPAGAPEGQDELFRTLLRGGISTSATVTEVAGRGIGLDVVRASAERLGGVVAIHSELGRGATVVLDVPVSLVSLDGLVVEAGGQAATIPLEAVRRTVRVRDDGDIVRSALGESIVYDGQAVSCTARPVRPPSASTGSSGRPP